MLGNFIFYDSDDESNYPLLTFGILQEDYSIPVPGATNGEVAKVSDFKGLETRRIFKEAFDRENRRTFSTNKFERVQRINSLEKQPFLLLF